MVNTPQNPNTHLNKCFYSVKVRNYTRKHAAVQFIYIAHAMSFTYRADTHVALSPSKWQYQKYKQLSYLCSIHSYLALGQIKVKAGQLPKAGHYRSFSFLSQNAVPTWLKSPHPYSLPSNPITTASQTIFTFSTHSHLFPASQLICSVSLMQLHIPFQKSSQSSLGQRK